MDDMSRLRDTIAKQDMMSVPELTDTVVEMVNKQLEKLKASVNEEGLDDEQLRIRKENLEYAEQIIDRVNEMKPALVQVLEQGDLDSMQIYIDELMEMSNSLIAGLGPKNPEA